MLTTYYMSLDREDMRECAIENHATDNGKEQAENFLLELEEICYSKE